jgi:hypothetical protein
VQAESFLYAWAVYEQMTQLRFYRQYDRLYLKCRAMLVDRVPIVKLAERRGSTDDERLNGRHPVTFDELQRMSTLLQLYARL